MRRILSAGPSPSQLRIVRWWTRIDSSCDWRRSLLTHGAGASSASGVLRPRTDAQTGAAADSVEHLEVEPMDAITVSVVSKVDAFAKSRLLNFAKRSGPSASCAFEVHRHSTDEFRATATLHAALAVPSAPAPIVGCGFAPTEKEAEAMASLHCERILDALGVPVFALESMQRKHAETAKADGRFAPMPGDPPRATDTAPLPVPLRLNPKASSIGSAKSLNPFATVVPSGSQSRRGKGRSGIACVGGMQSFQPPASSAASVTPMRGQLSSAGPAGAGKGLKTFRPFAQSGGGGSPRDRAIALAARAPRTGAAPFEQRGKYGITLAGDVDLSTVDAESELLFVNEILPPEDEEGQLPADDDLPQHLLAQGRASSDDVPAAAGRDPMRTVVAPDGPCPKIELNIPTRSHTGDKVAELRRRVSRPDDETEGGLWTLVECHAVFEQFPAALLLPCLHTAESVPRIDGFLRAHGETLTGSVVYEGTREPSGVAKGAVAYIAELLLPGSEFVVERLRAAGAPPPLLGKRLLWDVESGQLIARGHSSTQQTALELCAMHCELLIDQLGLLLFPADPQQQLKHRDDCRRAGRWAPASADDPDIAARRAAVDARSLCRPLKEWVMRSSVRNGRLRVRSAPLSPDEIVFHQHRQLVASMRSHVVETNFDGGYDAMGVLRQFMIDRGNRAEGLFVTHHYSPKSQFRCSVVLPLPPSFGLRGGYAIGETPEIAQRFCAMHAIDVLCALGIPVLSDPADQQKLIEDRRRNGLVVTPPNLASNVNPMIRSPPGYRQAHHAAVHLPKSRDVWNVMHTDVSDFDVCAGPPPHGGDTFPLQLLFEDMLVRLGVPPEEAARTRTLNHYYGHQRLGSRAVIPANSFWMDLPVDEPTFGRRVVLGRCVRRPGALRSFYVHGLRLGVALGLISGRKDDGKSHTATADATLQLPSQQTDNQRRLRELLRVRTSAAAQQAATSTAVHAKKKVSSGAAISPAALLDPMDLVDASLFDTRGQIGDEAPAHDSSRDWKSVPSPNPVMSEYLAERVM